MAFKELVNAFKNEFKKAKEDTFSKVNPDIKHKLLNDFNELVKNEGFKFTLNGDRITPDNIEKALNSEMGTPTDKGQSTTKEIPKELIRTEITKLKSNMRFLKYFDLKLKLDRPNKIFQIDIIAKEKEKQR